MMHGDVGDHIIAHALAEIGIDEADDRRVGQSGMLHQRIHTRAQRQHRLEAIKSLECIGLGFPHEDVAHIRRVEGVAAPHHGVGR
ncbi:hypothetical protein D3C86_2121710 [compost metagenome]